MKKFAKIGALFMSFVLVIVATVGITLAYLTNTTSAVTNTFVAKSGLLQSEQTFTLDESPIKLADDGNSYVQAAGNKVTTNSYADLLAGMTLYKDPTVHLGKLAATAYLFVEIKETNFPAGDILDYEVTADWTLIGETAGKNGGALYVYSNAEKAPNNILPITGAEDAALGDVSILVDNQVTVGNFEAAAFVGTATLTVYGYLCQTAGFATATAAYQACFPAVQA